MVVGQDAADFGQCRADFLRQPRTDHRSERWIDTVEGHAAFRRIERELAVLYGIAATWSLDAGNARLVELLRAGLVQIVIAVWTDERDIGGVGTEELRLGGAVVAGADHAHALVGHFVTVANRAIAQQTA